MFLEFLCRTINLESICVPMACLSWAQAQPEGSTQDSHKVFGNCVLLFFCFVSWNHCLRWLQMARSEWCPNVRLFSSRRSRRPADPLFCITCTMLLTIPNSWFLVFLKFYVSQIFHTLTVYSCSNQAMAITFWFDTMDWMIGWGFDCSNACLVDYSIPRSLDFSIAVSFDRWIVRWLDQRFSHRSGRQSFCPLNRSSARSLFQTTNSL